MKKSSTDKVQRMEWLVEILKTREMEQEEMVRELGMSASAIRKYVRELREDGEIYISGWRLDKNFVAARFKAGSRPDTPLPEGRCKQGRVKGSPEKKTRPGSIKAAFVNDPLMSAFFGKGKSA